MPAQNQGPKHRDVLHLMAMVSVLGHVFCCGLPMVLGLVSLLAGMGAMAHSFPGLHNLHNFVHAHEGLLIGFSMFMLALGWGFQIHANKVDCHDTGCSHPPCEPKKSKASKLLLVATVLFLLNALNILFLSHHDVGQGGHPSAVSSGVEQH